MNVRKQSQHAQLFYQIGKLSSNAKYCRERKHIFVVTKSCFNGKKSNLAHFIGESFPHFL